MLLFIITAFAGRHRVSLCRRAAPYDRDYMVHGQLMRRRRLSAIVTFPYSTLSFPPLGLSKLSGFLFFFLNLLLGNVGNEVVHYTRGWFW